MPLHIPISRNLVDTGLASDTDVEYYLYLLLNLCLQQLYIHQKLLSIAICEIKKSLLSIKVLIVLIDGGRWQGLGKV